MTNSTISSSGCARPMLGENPRDLAARHSRAVYSAVAMISAKDGWLEMTIVERVARNIDHAAVQRMQQDEAARATTQRIAQLRHIVFRNAAHNRDIERPQERSRRGSASHPSQSGGRRLRSPRDPASGERPAMERRHTGRTSTNTR